MTPELPEGRPVGATLTLRTVVPVVSIVIADSTGEIMGLISGEAPDLASLLDKWYNLDTPVVRRVAHERVTGQSIFEVSPEWLAGIRFALVSRPLEELMHLPERIPATARITVVVTR